MNVVFLGPPGVGKGTQARILAEKFKLTPVSTGDMIRSEVANGTPLGLEAKKYSERGNLVPDDVIIGMMERLMGQAGAGEGFLLDGFPRTIAQAEGLDRMLKGLGRDITAVVALDVSDDTVVGRLGDRRVCPVDGRVYNLSHQAPKVSNRCDDHPEAELVLRTDDAPETVRHRLNVYKEQTAPLIDYYAKGGALEQVDADGSIEDVTRRIETALNQAVANQVAARQAASGKAASKSPRQ